MKDLPWATLGVWLLTLVVALVGGAVVIWGHDGALSFEDYTKILAAFAVAHGALGIGRGVKAGLENHATLSGPLLTDEALLNDLPEAEMEEEIEEEVAAPPVARTRTRRRSSHV